MGDCNCKSGSNGSNGHCVECDITQLARNNYFTGKLLVERDFTDEQRYTMGKLRRHNQRLHGWGAVCGLKVIEHPNPSCQPQYVLIEPGYAIDCCGREIVVSHEDYFDFAAKFLSNWQNNNGQNSQPDTKEHTIQICVSYRECATENVPALFDDCSPGSCQPNRILESYNFDVVIDPKPSSSDPHGVELKWDSTIGVEGIVRVVENDASGTLYALASSGTTATLYAVDTGSGSVSGARSFANNTGLDVQVSPEGDFVYVALQPATPSNAAPQILVIKTSALATTVNTLTVTNSENGDALRLAVVPAPDGRLLSTVPSQNTVLVWDTDIQTTSFAAPTAVSVGTTPVDIAIDGGSYAYVANSGSNNVTAIALGGSGFPTTSINAGFTGTPTPFAVGVATTTAGDTLAVLDKTNSTLYLISIPSAGPGSAAAIGSPVTTLSNTLMDVGISPGGRWVYVLEEDTSTPPNGYLQVVDAHAVATNQPNSLGTPIKIVLGPENEALSGDGSHIYVPYTGNPPGVPSGVAVIDVTQNGCPDLFQCAIERCPDCSEGNCIVLATIKGYVYQTTAVTDSLIDNLTDRHLLVSTDLLTQVVRCVLDQGTGGGGSGTQGPPGQNGAEWYEGSGAPAAATGNTGDFYLNVANGDVYEKQSAGWGTPVGNIKGPQGNAGINGAGITNVVPTFVACDVPGSASLTGPATSQTLNLTIPGCCNTSLTTIESISWEKNGGELTQEEAGIAFSGSVDASNLVSKTGGVSNAIQLLAATGDIPDLVSWEQVGIRITPGNFATVGDATSTFVPAAGQVNGVQFTPIKQVGQIDAKLFRVVVKCDFIADQNGYAVDGDHLPPWLPKQPTGDGIEGGTFESWYVVSS